MKKRKAFTLIELLVVVSIIALLVSILLPALGRARELAKRVQCATQLAGIGRAFALYQNDYDDDHPTVYTSDDATNSFYGTGYNNELMQVTNGDFDAPRFCKPDWQITQDEWQNPRNWPEAWKACPTAGGCMYLLIKLEDLVPKMFLCPSAPNDSAMVLDGAIDQYGDDTIAPVEDWTDCRDFGSTYNLSYSMHDPFKNRTGGSTSASMPVMADKNPCYDTETGIKRTETDYGDANQDPTEDKDSNSRNHNQDMQNVLYVGSNVSKENEPIVGIAEDNIYTQWDESLTDDTGRRTIGIWPDEGTSFDELSLDTNDCFMITQ